MAPKQKPLANNAASNEAYLPDNLQSARQPDRPRPETQNHSLLKTRQIYLGPNEI
jgi:hypothetical protein